MQEILYALLQRAQEYQTPDIHFIPQPEFYEISIRTSLGLKIIDQLDKQTAQRFLNYIKFESHLNVGERRLPQSGTLYFEYKELSVTLRLSTITNFQGDESLVIRIHQNKSADSFQSLYDSDIKYLEKLFRLKSGLILFSGPVASGKTTTLYYFLNQVFRSHPLQIITMEDPVEIHVPHFLQTEVNHQAGITYDVLIKSALRHHPDIILIGEVRDSETAQMMIRAALTGHLVLATIHAKNTVGVLNRLMELGVSKQQLVQSLIAVTAQRLVPLKSSAHKKAVIFERMTGTEVEDYLIHHKPLKEERQLNAKLQQAVKENLIDSTTRDIFQLV
ncbi:competence type IV pilus ATPase ComGA [Atopobacter phocae]|uniref:competence type IV pilus ATPase ComGA n=1 Tax=Atopobacter phocae TaxID=136492 RepID=UPI000470561A|nr:competence type IV pilus ATPase ComGA [Atopobacter phocae]